MVSNNAQLLWEEVFRSRCRHKKLGLERKNVSTVKELVVYCKNAVFTVSAMHKKCPFKRTIRKEHFYIHTFIHSCTNVNA